VKRAKGYQSGGVRLIILGPGGGTTPQRSTQKKEKKVSLFCRWRERGDGINLSSTTQKGELQKSKPSKKRKRGKTTESGPCKAFLSGKRGFPSGKSRAQRGKDEGPYRKTSSPR